MSRRVTALTVAQFVAAAVCLAVAHVSSVPAARALLVLPAAAAFAVVGSIQLHVEFRRHSCAVTFVEALVVIGFVHLGLAEVVIAAALGELFTCIAGRQPLRQLAFNVSAAAAATSTAALVFSLAPSASPAAVTTWIAALGAAAFYGLASHASTSAVLSIVDGRKFADIFSAAIVPSSAATVVSGTLGLLAVVVGSISPWAVLLIVPLVVLMVVETRRLAVYRADQMRFERLYAASARSGGLTSLPDAMGMLAEEARSLVTGAAGICCTIDRDEQWCGVVVADTGARPATPHEVTAMRSLADGAAASELTADDVPDELSHFVVPFESLVFARGDESGAAPVVVAVARQLPADSAAHARADVLAAFMGHAALTIANARLYADVEAALEHQLDLSRQKDDFVAVVSHELRTPLTSMIGSMSTMRRFGDQLATDKREKLVDIALRQGDRLKQLIEDLLLISKIEGSWSDADGATDAVDMRAMVAELGDHFAVARPGTTAVAVSYETVGVDAVRSDEARLRQILTNLIENASKYAPSSPVVVRAERHGDDVSVSVIDQGPGIAAEDRERVFERFVQLDQTATRANGGTGLGLYLCRRLAEGLGGTLTLGDADGGGCCFTLTLPSDVVELPDTSSSAGKNSSVDAGPATGPISGMAAGVAPGFGIGPGIQARTRTFIAARPIDAPSPLVSAAAPGGFPQ